VSPQNTEEIKVKIGTDKIQIKLLQITDAWTRNLINMIDTRIPKLVYDYS
jgi:hypothetical protein